MFYKLLAQDREFNHPKWPFLIKVRDVQGSEDDRRHIQAQGQGQQRIRRRDPGQDGRAPFRPDEPRSSASTLEHSEIQHSPATPTSS